MYREINGIYTSTKIFTTPNETNAIDDYAIRQLQMLCDNEVSKDCQIRVMPDVHPGKVATIGLTMTVGTKIMPNLVGKVIIPVNMRDGIILGTGLGNRDWNCSAPHGAGRIMKREDIKSHFTVSAYKAEMKGIYSTCIGKETLDEAPFAYRTLEDIQEAISDTVNIDTIIHPIYNYKAGGN